MRFAVAATFAGLSAVVAADGWTYGGYGPPPSNTTTSSAVATTTAPPMFTTEVVTQLTTYCPEKTKITHGGVTYTITAATTLTITDCPCTVTKPILSTSLPVPSVPVSPIPPPPYPSGNTTAPPMGPTGTGAFSPPATTSPIAPGYTGAASKASFGVVLAAAGLIAAL